MTYGSVCSGIEAATVAWEPLGWKPAFFAEIEKFPCAVLQHRFPHVPNHGDFTTIQPGDYETDGRSIDLLVGGTPCQDFSIAGLRTGVDGTRGNLTLEFLRLVDRTRPRWVVWENVPGVLSSVSHAAPNPLSPADPLDLECDGQEVDIEDEYNGEEVHALQCFLAGLSEIGYGWAYRVLDAQYFGLAQRRKRVYVVGCLGDGLRAAAVFQEFAGLSGHPEPRRAPGKGFTHDVAPCLRASGCGFSRTGDTRGQDPVVCVSTQASAEIGIEIGTTLTCDHKAPYIAKSVAEIAGSLCSGGRAGAFSGQDAYSGRLVAFTCKDHGADAGELSPTLRSMGHNLSHANGGGQVAIAFTQNQEGSVLACATMHALGTNANASGRNAPNACIGWDEELTPSVELAGTLGHGGEGGRHDGVLTPEWIVRALTPRECERLQGFPDDWTLIPYGETRTKYWSEMVEYLLRSGYDRETAERLACCPDGPRYKACGNAMPVNVMRWIGERIEMVELLEKNPN